MEKLYWKLVGAFALFVLGFCVAWCWQSSRIKSLQAEHQQAVNDAKEENRKVEKKLQAQADDLTVKYQKEQLDAQKTITDLRRRISDGTLRLSVPAQSTSGMSNGSSTEHPERRTELDGQTAQALISITADGDRAIRKLNQCIDRYEALRQ